jgi:hypothetical protein
MLTEMLGTIGERMLYCWGVNPCQNGQKPQLQEGSTKPVSRAGCRSMELNSAAVLLFGVLIIKSLGANMVNALKETILAAFSAAPTVN